MDTRSLRRSLTGRRGLNGLITLALTAGLAYAVAYAGPDQVRPAAVAVKPPGPPSPDAAMPPDQRDAKYKALQEGYFKKFDEWLQSDFVKSQDLRSLPQSPLLGEPVPGYHSLEEAVDHADIVVLGKVVAVTTGTQTETTFRVERTAKGTPASTISFVQAGGIRPGADFDHPIMAVDEASPMLFPGDRAVLLLELLARTGRWRIQNYSGEYRTDPAGNISSTPQNRFHDVDAMTETQLLDRIEHHVHRN